MPNFGRVWTGKKAVELGLADQVGGIEEAIKLAAKTAKISDYRVKTYPESKNLLEILLDKPVNEFSSQLIKKELGEESVIWKRIQSLKKEKGETKALLPYEFSIR